MQAQSAPLYQAASNSAERKVRKPRFGVWLAAAMLILFFLIILLPLVWMIVSSLKETTDIFGHMLSLPKTWHFENYKTAWNVGISRYFINSVIITVSTCVLTVLFSAFGGFALTRFEFPGRNLLFLLLLAGFMSSPQVGLIPLYSQIQSMGLLNTYWALVLPYVSYQIPISLMLFRSHFLGIDHAYDESAYIDGCTSMGVLMRIILPLSMPIVITATILTAFFAWNEFMFSIVFISGEALKTVPSGLLAFRDALHTDWGVMLAGLTISSLPVILVFIFTQRYFVSGLSEGGVKG